ncbi:hypothetical protein TNCV_1573331 [Trichonephila clavipes]|uniref:Uncharacterized protein n=1 Tax=Trichonephila clavipes TaxID=2585209 RepID=A0A8X6SUG5_TRICX|nr:hypothetical protein TNCV_1573331 [Trichonephila clavipes]
MELQGSPLPSGSVSYFHAKGPVFRPQLDKVDSAFHSFSGMIKEYKACLGTKLWGVSRQIDHLTVASAFAPKCPRNSRQINFEVDNDDVQELLDSHNWKLTVDDLIEIHEQEQDIEEHVFRPSLIRKPNDGWEFDRRPQFN